MVNIIHHDPYPSRSFNYTGDDLAKLDVICDLIPVISTVSNCVNVFQKAIAIVANASEATDQKEVKSHYYTHLEAKSFLFCSVCLIPVIGNVITFIYYFGYKKYGDKEAIVKALKEIRGDDAQNKQIELVKSVSPWLRDDADFMANVVKLNSKLLEFASDRLKDDRDFMKSSINSNRELLRFASDRLQEDPEFIQNLVMNACSFEEVQMTFMKSISPRLKDNGDFMTSIVQSKGKLLEFASNRLKDDPAFIENIIIKAESLEQVQDVFVYVSPRLKNNADFMLKVIAFYPDLYAFVGQELKDQDPLFDSFIQNVILFYQQIAEQEKDSGLSNQDRFNAACRLAVIDQIRDFSRPFSLQTLASTWKNLAATPSLITLNIDQVEKSENQQFENQTETTSIPDELSALEIWAYKILSN